MRYTNNKLEDDDNVIDGMLNNKQGNGDKTSDTNVAEVVEEIEFEESDDSVRDPIYESASNSLDDTDDSNNENQTRKKKVKGRKRKRDEKKWKINKQYRKVISGLKHKTKKKVILKETVGPPCDLSCRFKCIQRIPEEERKTINAKFWDGTKDINQKRQFVASYVKYVPILRKRSKTGARNDARGHTKNYFFL